MPTDDEWLFPLLNADGRKLLYALRESPFAPRYTHVGCDRLNAQGLERVRSFEKQLGTIPIGWLSGELPDWLPEFVERCMVDVPFYRRYGLPPNDFFSLPAFGRPDLSREPWSFVPDSLPLDDMALYQTSGITGHPLNIITHPEPLAMYIPMIRAALARRGVELQGGPGRVSIVLVCFQKSTWTYVSISPVLNQAGFVKVNLNRDEWREPADRARFLDECDPEIYTGDPISFSELARLPLKTHPKALISTSMKFSLAQREQLERHFNCPVLDIYSMNETGPIAVAQGDDYFLLHHRLYVEVLHVDGTPCNPGERGEIVLSGGLNPFLPLLRYRTGDYASLNFRDRVPMITGLEGRPPVVFRGTGGQFINNIDISTALKPLGLSQYSLHQSADSALVFKVRGNTSDEFQLRKILLSIFGADQVLTVEELDAFPTPSGKVLQYTSDITQT